MYQHRIVGLAAEIDTAGEQRSSDRIPIVGPFTPAPKPSIRRKRRRHRIAILAHQRIVRVGASCADTDEHLAGAGTGDSKWLI